MSSGCYPFLVPLPAVAAKAAQLSLANINFAVWEKQEKVTTKVGVVLVLCHLSLTVEQKIPLSKTLDDMNCLCVKDTSSYFMPPKKNALPVIKSSRQTTAKQAYVQSSWESKQNVILPEPGFTYRYPIWL